MFLTGSIASTVELNCSFSTPPQVTVDLISRLNRRVAQAEHHVL